MSSLFFLTASYATCSKDSLKARKDSLMLLKLKIAVSGAATGSVYKMVASCFLKLLGALCIVCAL